jgi:uncharacterized protein (DUF111 family)
VAQIGYGAGSREFVDTPNVLRVLIGEADATSTAAGGHLHRSHPVVVVECEIDDMNPQIFGALVDRLLSEERSTSSTRRCR